MWVTLSLRKKELKQEHTYYQLQDLQISRQKRQLDRRKRYEQSLIQLNQKRALAPIKKAYTDQVAELNKSKEALTQYLLAVKKIKNNSLENYVIDGADKNKVYIKSDGGKYICESDGNGAAFYKADDLELRSDGKYYENGVDVPISATTNSDGAVQRYELAYDLSNLNQSAVAMLAKYNLSTDLSTIDENTDLSTLESTVNSIQSSISYKLQEAQVTYQDSINAEKELWENELEMMEEEVGDQETELELEQTDIETQMEFISNELQAMNDAVSQGIQQSTIKLS